MGVLRLADTFHVTLAGGDTAQSPGGIFADIVVVGSAPRGKAVPRSGAKPGDRIYVTGALGGSAAALRVLLSGHKLRPAGFSQHFLPQPRIAVGEFLREKRLASAMIDLSDGLSTDLAHICEESGVGAQILANALPLAAVGKPAREVELRLALHGGEDYELLFTAPPGKRLPQHIAGVKATQVGHITREKRLILMNELGVAVKLRPQGWEHFSSRQRLSTDGQ